VSQGEYINVKEKLSLEKKIIKNSSVSLSPTLNKNKKIKQKTHKLNLKVLKFISFLFVSPIFLSSIFSI